MLYNKILVPLDGSNFSECILSHVKAVAAGCKVPQVVLLRVVEPWNTTIYEVSQPLLEQAQKEKVANAKDYVAKLAASLGKEGLAIETAVMEGPAAEVILDYAKKSKADLIMMSSHGRSGVTRWALGSVTDRVVRQSPIPVMIAAPAGCPVGESRW